MEVKSRPVSDQRVSGTAAPGNHVGARVRRMRPANHLCCCDARGRRRPRDARECPLRGQLLRTGHNALRVLRWDNRQCYAR